MKWEWAYKTSRNSEKLSPMGTVYAKAKSLGESEEATSKDVINLDGIKARVDKVHVDGLGRTRDDIVVTAVHDLFQAQDFKQVILKIHEVKSHFEALGLFRKVGVLIDTSHGPDSSPDGLEVTFFVHEHRRLTGGISTVVGNNEGSLVLGARLPNIVGRGEKVQVEYAHGTQKSTGFNLTLTKPLLASGYPFLTSAVFQQSAELPWSGFGEIDRGVLAELAFESAPKVKHNLRWEGVWRELGILPSTISFAVREEMGHTIKSALKHTLTVDHRDDMVLPTRGVLFRMQQEFAGLGGDIGFLKNEAELQANLRLPLDWVLQGCVSGGYLQQRSHDKAYNIADRFYLGGPLTLRGFETRGAGPHSEGSAVGSDGFWMAAVHLYTPLPFRPGRGGLGEIFRMHAFANVGNIGVFHLRDDYQQLLANLWERRRWAVGAGLVIRIGQVARLEVNYCVPGGVESGDRACHGLQFGLGITYW